jgi:succinate dehydrogenase / fumarate reductase cytochrome b subunit
VTRAQALFAVALTAIAVLILVVTGFVLSWPVWPQRRGLSRRKGPTLYRGATSQWAFLAHRVTGFLVFAFLMLHIVDVSLVRWPSLYDDVHRLYGNVVLRLFEVGLLFALLFHALNGLRLIAVDFFPGVIAKERNLLAVAVGLTVAAGVPGAVVIMWPFFEGRF